MSNIEELQSRVVSAEARLELIGDEHRRYSDRLVSLMSAAEAQINQQSAEAAMHQQAMEALLYENEQLRTTLHSLLLAVEAGNGHGLTDTMRELEAKFSALLEAKSEAVTEANSEDDIGADMSAVDQQTGADSAPPPEAPDEIEVPEAAAMDATADDEIEFEDATTIDAPDDAAPPDDADDLELIDAAPEPDAPAVDGAQPETGDADEPVPMADIGEPEATPAEAAVPDDAALDAALDAEADDLDELVLSEEAPDAGEQDQVEAIADVGAPDVSEVTASDNAADALLAMHAEDDPAPDSPPTDNPEMASPETDSTETDSPETDSTETDGTETASPEPDSAAAAAEGESPMKQILHGVRQHLAETDRPAAVG